MFGCANCWNTSWHERCLFFSWGWLIWMATHYEHSDLSFWFSGMYCWWFRNPLSPVEVGTISNYLQGFVHRGWLDFFHQEYRKKKRLRLCDTIRSFQSVQGAIPGRFWTKMFAEIYSVWGALKKGDFNSAFLFGIWLLWPQCRCNDSICIYFLYTCIYVRR